MNDRKAKKSENLRAAVGIRSPKTRRVRGRFEHARRSNRCCAGGDAGAHDKNRCGGIQITRSDGTDTLPTGLSHESQRSSRRSSVGGGVENSCQDLYARDGVFRLPTDCGTAPGARSDPQQKERPEGHLDHIHITANFKTRGGKIVSDSHNYVRSERVRRRLEKKLGLTIVPFSWDSNQSAPTVNEIRAAERTARKEQVIAIPPRVWIQQVIEAALNQKLSGLESFCKLLEADGVSVRLNQQSTGRVAGISFESNMIAFSGSSVGRKFTWLALQKRGLSYDPVRDAEAVYSRSRSAGTDRARSEIANCLDGVAGQGGVDEIAGTGEPTSVPGTAPITGRTNDGIRRNTNPPSPNDSRRADH